MLFKKRAVCVQTALFCIKKTANESAVFLVVGNKGLEPLTFSTSRRHSPN